MRKIFDNLSKRFPLGVRVHNNKQKNTPTGVFPTSWWTIRARRVKKIVLYTIFSQSGLQFIIANWHESVALAKRCEP